jgi:anhydro-N-acetylmuramic acid kinase
MSGTSLDGIDLAQIVLLVRDKQWKFEIRFETISYPTFWLNKLKLL